MTDVSLERETSRAGLNSAAETVQKASVLRGGEAKQHCPPAWFAFADRPDSGFKVETGVRLYAVGFRVIPPKARICEENIPI